jgi:hypothetical protein
MEWPASLSGIGAIIAIVCVILGILVMLEVIGVTPIVIGAFVVALAVARLT